MSLPIAWREGMALSPHHFQQNDLWLRDQIRARSGLPRHMDFGFSELSIQENSLVNGSFQIRSCEGCFQDGTYFSLSGENSVPSRSFTALFSPEKNSLDVFLAMRVPSEGSANLSTEPGRTAFREVIRNLPDFNTGSHPRNVASYQPEVTLLFEGENLSGFQLIPVARLRRNNQGNPAIEPEFFPVTTHIGAAQTLTSALGKLVTMVRQKIATIAATNPTLATANLQPILFLQAMLESVAVTEHLLAQPATHPSRLFEELLRLATRL